MRKLMMILFMVTIAAVNTHAQDNTQQPPPKKTPEERAESMTKRMAKELALNADQQAKVKAIILQREKERVDGEAKRKAEMDKLDADFKGILTADQYQKFEQKKAEMKEKHKDKGANHAPDNNTPPPAPPVQK